MSTKEQFARRRIILFSARATRAARHDWRFPQIRERPFLFFSPVWLEIDRRRSERENRISHISRFYLDLTCGESSAVEEIG